MDYDYIVVGSGAGGGPLAARLVEAGFSVLLLEAGPDDQGVLEQVPAFHAAASEDERISWSFFVRHYTDEQQSRRDWKYIPCADEPERGGVYYPRAATLGGCTQHHAMIVVRPHNSDWDGIAAITGDPSWAAVRMQRYFQRLERCEYRPFQRLVHRFLGWSPSGHGFDGWLPTTLADPKLVIGDRQIAEILIDSAHYALGHTRSRLSSWFNRLLQTLFTRGDPNDWQAIKHLRVGVRQIPLSVKCGRRTGVPERLRQVKAEHPGRLHMRTNVLVTRVLFEPDAPATAAVNSPDANSDANPDANPDANRAAHRAIGVEYLDAAQVYGADPRRRTPPADTPKVEVRAKREVILCGGAFNTPQLLQLSGIGPPKVLADARVPLRQDLPGVGANLQDRYEVGVVFRMKAPFAAMREVTMTPDPDDPHFRAWQRGEGLYTTNGALLGIIDRSKRERQDPDLFLFGLLTDFRGYYPGYSQRVRDARQQLTWAILKAHTENTAGQVAIRSADPLEPPGINFHFLNEGNVPEDEDIEVMVSAIRRVRRMAERYAELIEEEMVPGPSCRDSDPEREYQLLADFIRDQAWGHHACGTCKIGADDDPMAVLDSRFRVRGTEGLRVVDASVFPHIPGLFLVAPVYMVAEKAADVIIEDARGDVPPAE